MAIREWMREHDDPAHPLVNGPGAAIAMTILLSFSMLAGLAFIALWALKGF